MNLNDPVNIFWNICWLHNWDTYLQYSCTVSEPQLCQIQEIWSLSRRVVSSHTLFTGDMNFNDPVNIFWIFFHYTIGIRICNTLVDHNCVSPENLKFVTDSAEFPHFIYGRHELHCVCWVPTQCLRDVDWVIAVHASRKQVLTQHCLENKLITKMG